MKRPIAYAAAVAGIAAAAWFATPASAQQAAGVNFTGHICGTDNYGVEPTCTYKTTEATGYEGIGPFRITQRLADGTIKVWANCAANAQCGTKSATPIPAGTTITVSVSAEPGSVGLGGADAV
ncbi:MAG: hypothetical protein ACRDT4_08475 [Micromonosporaceae bacterium]